MTDSDTPQARCACRMLFKEDYVCVTSQVLETRLDFHFTSQESALLTLRLTRGPAAGTELVVQAPAQILGRTRVPRQLQIKDPNVSERHAQIAWDGKTWTVRDLGSSNGTTLNGRALERQGEGRPVLGRPALQGRHTGLASAALTLRNMYICRRCVPASQWRRHWLWG